MNTTTKAIAVLLVLGAIGGGAYLLRKSNGGEQPADQSAMMATTTTNTATNTPEVTTASSTLPVAEGNIDADLKAFSAEAQMESALASDNSGDGTTVMSDRTDVTSINDTYGESNF